VTDRRTGSVGASADLKNTNANQRQTGGVGASADLKNTNANNQRQTGAVGAMVDLAGNYGISQRATTTGVAFSGASFTITLPPGTTNGDIIVLVVANGAGGTTGPAVPTGWSLALAASAGSGHCCSVYTAQYSAALTLTFINAASDAAWVATSLFEGSGLAVSLDGTPVAASDTTVTTTAPTGAPTTGSSAGDYEILAYGWISFPVITVVAPGSSIDGSQANTTIARATIGHNTTTSLPANTTMPAFSQTLAATNTRKTGIGVLFKAVPSGPVTYPRTVTASQAQTATLSVQSIRAAVISLTATQTVALRRAVSLTRRVTQAQQVGIGGLAMRVLAMVQPTSARLVRQVRLARAVTQAQAATRSIGQGYIRTVTAVQMQAVRLVKQVGLMRRLTGTNRVQTQVALAPAVARTMCASTRTQVRLLKQVRLARALTQAQTATFSGLPVQLRVVSTVQTRSLALGRNVFLTRLIAQAQALVLKRDVALERTAVQPTRATLERAVSRVLTVPVATLASIEWRNVTPRYDILVTARVSQQVSLSSAGAGRTARQFVVDTRRVEFVVGQRSSGFAVGRRGVRFTVEER